MHGGDFSSVLGLDSEVVILNEVLENIVPSSQIVNGFCKGSSSLVLDMCEFMKEETQLNVPLDNLTPNFLVIKSLEEGFFVMGSRSNMSNNDGF